MAMPTWVEPQLATLTRERFSSPEWVFERKLDGERCLAFAGDDGVRLMSRSQHDITSTFPEVAAALAAQHRGDVVVDGEIVAFDGAQTRFERLQQRLGVASPGERLLRDFPVYYYLFDVLYADGVDTRPLPLTERKKLLVEAMSFRDPLRFTEHRWRDGEALSRQACADGWEGLVAKRADAPYTGTRSRNWLKFKCENAQEFVIGGYTDPQRSRVGFGALLLGYYDSGGSLVYAGKVGTGFDNRTLLRPARHAGRAGTGRQPLQRRPGAGPARGALGKAAACRGGRLQRVDRRGRAPPPPVPGAARRQGPARRRARAPVIIASPSSVAGRAVPCGPSGPWAAAPEEQGAGCGGTAQRCRGQPRGRGGETARPGVRGPCRASTWRGASGCPRCSWRGRRGRGRARVVRRGGGGGGALNVAVSSAAPSWPATTTAVSSPSCVRASASSSPISKKPGPGGAGVSAVSPAG